MLTNILIVDYTEKCLQLVRVWYVMVYISENQGQHKSQILYVYKITTDLQKYTLYTRKKSIYSIYQFIYLKFKHLNATVPL